MTDAALADTALRALERVWYQLGQVPVPVAAYEAMRVAVLHFARAARPEASPHRLEQIVDLCLLHFTCEVFLATPSDIHTPNEFLNWLTECLEGRAEPFSSVRVDGHDDMQVQSVFGDTSNASQFLRSLHALRAAGLRKWYLVLVQILDSAELGRPIDPQSLSDQLASEMISPAEVAEALQVLVSLMGQVGDGR